MIFHASVSAENIVPLVREQGYCFVRGAVSEDVLALLRQEMDTLDLQVGDHVHHPIGRGTAREVRQLHARSYHRLDDSRAPVANTLCYALASWIDPACAEHPELREWLPDEIGYQQYRGETDWISPHRDRRSDRMFSVTITIEGYAWMNLYEPLSDPVDYRNLRRVRSVLTGPGTVMFLRAPGLGSGEQVIHEVMPPIRGSRRILNLRMRPSLLLQPCEEGTLARDDY